MVFDSDGGLIQQATYYEGWWRPVDFHPPSIGTYYVGVYGAYGYGGTDVGFTILAADETPTLGVSYLEEGDQGRWEHALSDGGTFDLGTFIQFEPVGWSDQLRFIIHNLGGDGRVELTDADPYVALSPSGPTLTVLSGPFGTEIEWDEVVD